MDCNFKFHTFISGVSTIIHNWEPNSKKVKSEIFGKKLKYWKIFIGKILKKIGKS